MTGFFQFSNEKRPAVLSENPAFKVSDCAKYLGQAWGALSEVQKEPYHQASTEDKIRYEREMKQFTEKGFFINSKGENSTDHFVPKLTDDVVQPKRGLSSFMFFSMEEQTKLRTLFPGSSTTIIQTKVGEAWNKLSEKEAKRFNDMAAKDKIRQ